MSKRNEVTAWMYRRAWASDLNKLRNSTSDAARAENRKFMRWEAYWYAKKRGWAVMLSGAKSATRVALEPLP